MIIITNVHGEQEFKNPNYYHIGKRVNPKDFKTTKSYRDIMWVENAPVIKISVKKVT